MTDRKEHINWNSLTEVLPWLMIADHDRQSQVVCKDSSILGAWSVTGIDIESGHDYLLEDAAAQLDQAFRRVADYGSIVWSTVDRRPARTYIRGQFTNEVADYVDELWGNTFTKGKPLYENSHHLAVAMPTKGAALSFGELIGEGIGNGHKLPRAIVDALRARMRQSSAIGFRNREELDSLCRRFETNVAQVFDNAVTDVKLKRLDGNDLLGYLKSTASVNALAPVRYDPNAYLDAYLSDTFIDNEFKDFLHLRGLKEKYVGIFTLKDAPGGNMLQALNPLLALPVHLRITSCWKAATLRETEKFLSGARQFDEMRGFSFKKIAKKAASDDFKISGDDTPTTEVGHIAEDFKKLAKRREAFFGWLTSTVQVYGDSPKHLEDQMELVAQALERTNLVYIRERDGSLSGFCGGIPGHTKEVVRWHLVEASNVTDMVPIITLAKGDDHHPYFSKGLDVKLPPNATFRTRYNTVQYFNNHVGELGHTLIIGPSNNGKTIFQMFLEAQMLKYPNARIFNLDKDLSCKGPTLLMDGVHINLDPSAGKGQGIKMNPLKYANDDGGREWLVGWIDRILQGRGKGLSDADLETVNKALLRMAADPERRLTTLNTQLPDHLRMRLAPWCEGGTYGHYFDHVEDQFALHEVTTAEVGSLINAGLTDVVRAFSDYAFYCIERSLSGRTEAEIGPTCVYFEEAGFLLEDPIFARKARDYLMTLRKKRAHLVMTAQSPEPFITQPDLGAAVRDNIATVIFLPNAQAGRAELAKKYREAFGVNETQLSLIASAIPKMEYCIFRPQTNEFRVVQAKFSPEIISCLRSDAKSLALLDRYYDQEDAEWKEKYLNAVVNA
jgi:type IV secretion system protein TrbE